jgi:benzoyl-CoA reductase/2-hydroxyglutaryl-CoA dehydratase subunit BcrC/BadD/HgdB
VADMESLGGTKITPDSLRVGIARHNEKRRVLRAINGFRKLPEPPISGLDALLVSQVALNMDLEAFISAGWKLLAELEKRAAHGVSAYDRPGVRVIFAGTPSPMGHAKVHWAAEMSGLRIVADESCTGSRYYRDLVPEDLETVDEMVEAIADRYFRIDCPCFSPNTERFDNLRTMIGEYRAEAVVHNVLQFCHGFNIEAGALDTMLKKMGVPSLKIVSDFSEEEGERIRGRLGAFREVIENQ